MARMKPPFARMEHLDLLFGARRLWKLRFDSCRLIELENQILGFEREGDLPGEMIPYVYFEYLRKREAGRIVPILHHNAIDILTLACLTAIVPRAFQSPEDAPLTHGAEMVGLARWLCRCEQYEKALVLYRRALGKGLRDELMFRTLWDVARIEKKLGREDAALAVYTDLASGRNPFRLSALEETREILRAQGKKLLDGAGGYDNRSVPHRFRGVASPKSSAGAKSCETAGCSAPPAIERIAVLSTRGPATQRQRIGNVPLIRVNALADRRRLFACLLDAFRCDLHHIRECCVRESECRSVGNCRGHI